MAQVEEAHTGWLVTEDLRGLDPEASYIGAVPTRMTPEALLRLADSAQERGIEPLIHRVTARAPDGVSAFLVAPHLRRGRGGRFLQPIVRGVRWAFSAAWSAAQLSAKVVNSVLAPRTQFAAASSRPVLPPLQSRSVNPARPERTSRVRGSTALRRGAAERDTRDAGMLKGDSNELGSQMWQRAHNWTIVDGSGTPILRGASIGVEGESTGALRARRAPLEEIPGLPRDASITWEGQPDWSSSGVSRRAGVRNVGFVTRRAISEDGLNWAAVRRAASDSGIALGVSAARAPRAYDEALRRLETRFDESTAEEAIAAILDQLREPTQTPVPVGVTAESGPANLARREEAVQPSESVAPSTPEADSAARRQAPAPVPSQGHGEGRDDWARDEDEPTEEGYEYEEEVPVEEPPTERMGVAV